jgi:glyoxylase I family protein
MIATGPARILPSSPAIVAHWAHRYRRLSRPSSLPCTAEAISGRSRARAAFPLSRAQSGKESVSMIGGVHHTGISTPDIDRLIAFYSDVIGFELCYEMVMDQPNEQTDAMLEMAGVTVKMAMLRTGSSYIELLQFDTPAGKPRGPHWKLADHGHNHICLMVDDIDAEYARLKAAGMHFNAPPIHGSRPTTVCYGKDPDGNRIELMQFKDESVPYHYANRHIDRLKEVAP